jgi:phosphopantothenoylcysteine synthetase/decarboxylase
MHHQGTLPVELGRKLISHVKTVAGIDLGEHRRPTEGRMKLMIDNRHIDLRVSAIPTLHGQDLVVRLKPSRKIIKTVREAYPDLKIAGFKAETNVGNDELLSRAEESMRSLDLDLVVANDVSRGGMGTDDNRVIIIDRNGQSRSSEGKKSHIARSIIDALVEVLKE